MLTRRQNLLNVFQHQIPQWLPVTGHVDPYNQPSQKDLPAALAEPLKEVKWQDEATIAFSRYLGLEIMDWYKIPVKVTRKRVVVETFSQGETTIHLWHTPAGDLREIIRCCRGPGKVTSSNRVEHLVKGPEDLKALAAIFEDEVIQPDPQGLAEVRQRRQLIGEEGLLLGPMEGTPLGMMYRVFTGVETLAYLWTDARKALKDCFSVMEKNYLQRLRLALQSDLDAIVTVDDTSTTAVSPAMFEVCNLDLTNRRSRLTHQAGKLYFHHSCGHIRDLLPLYRQTEMDAVHFFTIPPLGNVTVGQGRCLLGDRITIIAGLVQLAEPMDDLELVRRSITEMLSQAVPWDHFILSVAAYPHRTMEQTKFVVDCVREFDRKHLARKENLPVSRH